LKHALHERNAFVEFLVVVCRVTGSVWPLYIVDAVLKDVLVEVVDVVVCIDEVDVVVCTVEVVVVV